MAWRQFLITTDISCDVILKYNSKYRRESYGVILQEGVWMLTVRENNYHNKELSQLYFPNSKNWKFNFYSNIFANPSSSRFAFYLLHPQLLSSIIKNSHQNQRCSLKLYMHKGALQLPKDSQSLQHQTSYTGCIPMHSWTYFHTCRYSIKPLSFVQYCYGCTLNLPKMPLLEQWKSYNL